MAFGGLHWEIVVPAAVSPPVDRTSAGGARSPVYVRLNGESQLGYYIFCYDKGKRRSPMNGCPRRSWQIGAWPRPRLPAQAKQRRKFLARPPSPSGMSGVMGTCFVVLVVVHRRPPPSRWGA